MNSTIRSLLHCPICHAPMQEEIPEGRICFCTGERRHSYDFSKSGYLNFKSPRDGDGDKKAAVRARTLFLRADYYRPLVDALCDCLEAEHARTVLDAGCGEGYYTNLMAKDRDVYGVDLSKDGIDTASKSAKMMQTRAFFSVGSLFTLPVKDESFDAVTNLFAPCAEEEFLRVLKKSGALILVGAGERHLFGLKEILYENPYINQGRADLPEHMKKESHRRLHYEITVTGKDQIDALFSMTPYYWRTSVSDRQKLEAIDVLQTEVDFDIYLYRKEASQ